MAGHSPRMRNFLVPQLIQILVKLKTARVAATGCRRQLRGSEDGSAPLGEGLVTHRAQIQPVPKAL